MRILKQQDQHMSKAIKAKKKRIKITQKQIKTLKPTNILTKTIKMATLSLSQNIQDVPPIKLKRPQLKPLQIVEDEPEAQKIMCKSISQRGSENEIADSSTARKSSRNSASKRIYSARNLTSKRFEFPTKPQTQQTEEDEEAKRHEREKELTFRIIQQLDKEKKCLEDELSRLKEGAVEAIMEKDYLIQKMKERIEQNEAIKRQLEQERDSQSDYDDKKAREAEENLNQLQLARAQSEVRLLEDQLRQITQKYQSEIKQRDQLICQLGEDLDRTRSRLEECFATQSSLADQIKKMVQQKEELEGELAKSRLSLSQMVESSNAAQRISTLVSGDAVSEQASSQCHSAQQSGVQNREEQDMEVDTQLRKLSAFEIQQHRKIPRIMTPNARSGANKLASLLLYKRSNKQKLSASEKKAKNTSILSRESKKKPPTNQDSIIETLKDLNEQEKARHKKEVESIKREYEERLTSTRVALEKQIKRLQQQRLREEEAKKKEEETRNYRQKKSEVNLKPIKSEYQLEQAPSQEEQDEEKEPLKPASKPGSCESLQKQQQSTLKPVMAEEISELESEELRNFQFQSNIEPNQNIRPNLPQRSPIQDRLQDQDNNSVQGGIKGLARDIALLTGGLVISGVCYFASQFV